MYNLKPTLFASADLTKDGLMYRYQLESSLNFLNCADKKLTELFIRVTGLKPNKNLSFSMVSHFDKQPILETGEVSKLNINLYVNHNWNPIVVLWKSKSSRIYKINDTDINCDDIEFWFEKLDTELYIKQYYPNNQKLPFVLKTPFEVIVTRLNIDCTVQVIFKKGYEENCEAVIKKTYSFIDKFNVDSEKKEREEGVVHNYSGKCVETNVVVFEIDLGSVGFSFFKKLLKFFSKIEGIEKIEIA